MTPEMRLHWKKKDMNSGVGSGTYRRDLIGGIKIGLEYFDGWERKLDFSRGLRDNLY